MKSHDIYWKLKIWVVRHPHIVENLETLTLIGVCVGFYLVVFG